MPRSRSRVSYAKQAFYVVCILGLLAVGLFSYFGPGGYREYKKVQAELSIQRARRDALANDRDQRVKSVDLLRNDMTTIESIARKKGYGKKGEIVEEIPLPEPAPRPPVKGK